MACQLWDCGLPAMGLRLASYGPVACQLLACGLPAMGLWLASYGPVACQLWACGLPVMGLWLVSYDACSLPAMMLVACQLSEGAQHWLAEDAFCSATVISSKTESVPFTQFH